MGETRKPNNSDPDPVSKEGHIVPSIEELDETLAQAADDAASIVEEVGTPEPAAPTVAPAPRSSAPGPPEQVVAEELERVETLAKSASEELGVEARQKNDVPTQRAQLADHASSPATSALDELDALLADPADQDHSESRETESGGAANQHHTPDSGSHSEDDEGLIATEPKQELDDNRGDPSEVKASSPSNTAEAIPDFMREFMDTEEPDPSKPGQDAPPQSKPTSEGSSNDAARPENKLQPQGRPGVVGTGMLGVVGSVPPMPDQGSTEPTSPTDEESDSESNDSIEPQAAIGRFAVLALLKPTGMLILDQLATLLISIDKPFKKIGPGVRLWIGRAALATLGTAFVVFLAAMF